MNNERVQILLTPGQRTALALKSRQSGRCISDLVREYVQKGLDTTENKVDVLDLIHTHRQLALSRRAGKPILTDPLDILREIREERSDKYGGD